jgi:alkylation response protein AidB-like acyl-CoA dehydrogenase
MEGMAGDLRMGCGREQGEREDGVPGAWIGLAVSYAKERVQFGAPIANNQAIQFKLAQIATELAASRALTWAAATAEHTSRAGRLAAQAKVYASEAANRACQESLQIHGGNGFHDDYEISRLYRDVRVTTLYEGTSEMQRMVIARSLLQR